MLRLAHVIESSSPRALRLALHDFNTLDIRAVDLVPHLDTDAGHLVAEEDRRVDFGVALADVEADAGERVAGLLAHEQDVADAGAVGVCGVEKTSTSAGGIEGFDLRGGQGADGVGALFARGGFLRSDGDFAHAFLEAWVGVSGGIMDCQEQVFIRFCLVA